MLIIFLISEKSRQELLSRQVRLYPDNPIVLPIAKTPDIITHTKVESIEEIDRLMRRRPSGLKMVK